MNKEKPSAFEHSGFRFSGGSPSLHLLRGSDESPWNWCATPPEPTVHRQRQTPLGEGIESISRWEVAEGYHLEWRVTKLSRFPGFSFRTIFTNASDEPVRLRRLGILESPASALRVDSADWFVSSSIGGWDDPSAGRLDKTGPAGRHFRDFAAIYSEMGERGVFMAAVGPAESDVSIDIFRSPEGYSLSVFSEMSDILVESGESRTSEEFVFLFAPYQEASECAMRWIAATHGSRLHRGAFTGWCSWYEQYTNVSAGHVVEVANALKKHRSFIPHAVIQIDEGYEKAWGDWRLNEKFPEGWEPVTRAIRDAGAIPGVWLAPLGVYDSLNLQRERPDWFQFPAGRLEPAGMNFRGNALHFLDPTHPDVQQFVRQIIREAMANGFRYFKIDFNHIEACRFFDPKQTRFQAYRNLYRLYREEMGEESYLNSCCARLDRAVVGFVDAMRIGADSDYQWPWILKAIRGTSETCPANGILMAADPDVFFTRPRPQASSPVTKEQLDSWQGLVGLLGGLVMTSEPLHTSAYQESFRELEILIPPVPERGRSFLPGMEVYPSLFGFIAERSWGDFAVVQMFNAQDKTADVPLRAPALDRLGPCHLWSFRDGQYLGIGSSSHNEKNLPPWGSRLLRMTPVGENPVLVGSDLHMGMGAAEIKKFAAGKSTLSIELTEAGARSGSLWIHSQECLQIEFSEGCDVELEKHEYQIWEIQISNRRRGEHQKLVFAMGRAPTPIHKASPAQIHDPSLLRLKLDCTQTPCLGGDSRPGVIQLSISNVSEKEASGEIHLISEGARFLHPVPARIPYQLSPGAEFSCPVELFPTAYTPQCIVAASIQDSNRAWTPVTMRRAPIKIPRVEELTTPLSMGMERMPALHLPNDPPAVRLRMAATSEALFFELDVVDSKIAPNLETFWEGSCVEFFFAKPGSRDIRQFFFQANTETNLVRIHEAGHTGQERVAQIKASASRTESGYQLTVCVPRSVAGITSTEKEWLLEIQVSRFEGKKLEHIPLFGGMGAYASSNLYAHVIEEYETVH